MLNKFVDEIYNAIEKVKIETNIDIYFAIGNTGQKTLSSKINNKWIEIQEPKDFPIIILDTSELQFSYSNRNSSGFTTFSANISIIDIKRTNLTPNESDNLFALLTAVFDKLGKNNIRFINSEYTGIYFDDVNYFGVAVTGSFIGRF